MGWVPSWLEPMVPAERSGPRSLAIPKSRSLASPSAVTRMLAGFTSRLDHQVLVGDLNRGANLAKELQPFRYRQLLLVAVLVDRLSLDVLHDQERPAVLGRAAGVELGDVWMVDRGQDLPLVAEPADEVSARRGAPEELDGHGSPELVVLPLGQIDRPPPPMGNLPNQPIGTDEQSVWRRDRLSATALGPSPSPSVSTPAGFGLILEE